MASLAVMSSSHAHSTGSTATGVLALLDEDDNALRAGALQKLNECVDYFWAEIADSVPLIESLAEDETFSHRELAAAVASKCFYHLEEYNDALRLAFGAGQYFDVHDYESQYIETLIATCIDEYIALKTEQQEQEKCNNGVSEVVIDPRMEDIVEQMFERCYNAGTFTQALGIALESRRLDKVKEVLSRTDDVSGLLSYCFDICRTIVTSRDFRLKVIQVMVETYKSLPVTEYSNICQCYQLLNQWRDVAKVLNHLITLNTSESLLVAYQVAFDLCENDNQFFLMMVISDLPKKPQSDVENLTQSEEYWQRLAQLKKVLTGEVGVDLFVDFGYRSSASDGLLMKEIKTSVESRTSVLHNAAVVAHGYLNAGTTRDDFLRNNLDWLGTASNWAKFTATASIGVVHKGHVKESMNLLSPYFPSTSATSAGLAGNNNSSSCYSAGGSLYALGLIHGNKAKKETMDFIREALRNANGDEVVQHGACLGIGLCGMGNQSKELYDELRNVLFSDSAVAGEAAALGIGLSFLQSSSSENEGGGEIVQELLTYAHETKHEKIIRGCGLGIALISAQQEEQADTLIEQLSRDKDPLIRYGGMFTIGMAYVGTGSNQAIRKLLHVAVSDVNDDVRRAAVLNLGFILFRTPVKVPKLVSLLAESFNPHVRYGSCLAVGIACAGTCKNEAIQLLEPMCDDAVDYVRQGAMMALAMVLMQSNQKKSASFRAKLLKCITDKHVSTMTKMGAILAQGILDGGGNNYVISMQSHTGFTRMSSVVGLVLWAQHWFWYPLFNSLVLAFQPTVCIGLNKEMNLPKHFKVNCIAKRSQFSYPKPMEEKKQVKVERVATAILSTTAKTKAKQEAKTGGKKIHPPEKMDVVKEEEEKEEKEDKKCSTKEEKPEEDEADSFLLPNPARVTLAQELVTKFDLTQRYIPVEKTRRAAGIIMLHDTQPESPEEVVHIQTPCIDQEEEAEPPQPFEWTYPSSS